MWQLQCCARPGLGPRKTAKVLPGLPREQGGARARLEEDKGMPRLPGPFCACKAGAVCVQQSVFDQNTGAAEEAQDASMRALRDDVHPGSAECNLLLQAMQGDSLAHSKPGSGGVASGERALHLLRQALRAMRACRRAPARLEHLRRVRHGGRTQEGSRRREERGIGDPQGGWPGEALRRLQCRVLPAVRVQHGEAMRCVRSAQGEGAQVAAQGPAARRAG